MLGLPVAPDYLSRIIDLHEKWLGHQSNGKQLKLVDLSINDLMINNDLSGSLSIGSIFNRIQFDSANLTQSTFRDCRFNNCNFSKCDATKITFNNCHFINTIISNNLLLNMSLTGSSLTKSSVIDNVADGSKIVNLQIAESSLLDSSFIMTDFGYSSFVNVKFSKRTCFKHANFFKSFFSGTDIEESSFSEILIGNGKDIKSFYFTPYVVVLTGSKIAIDNLVFDMEAFFEIFGNTDNSSSLISKIEESNKSRVEGLNISLVEWCHLNMKNLQNLILLQTEFEFKNIKQIQSDVDKITKLHNGS